MPAEILDLQSRVATDLTTRAPSFSITGWTAEAPFIPKFDMPEIASLKVLVCPASRAAESTSRQIRSRTLGIWVGMLKHLTVGNDEAADLTETAALLTFAEEMADLFLPRNGSIYRLDQYRALEVTANPVYDLEKLRSNREFRSALLVNFRVDQ
jgi:hypothetical protein